MALCAFTKIAFGLLEPSLAAEQVRQLDQALRTHPRGGAAWASLLQSLLSKLFPGAQLPVEFALLKPDSLAVHLSRAVRLSFNVFEVISMGGVLLRSDMLAGHKNKLLDCWTCRKLQKSFLTELVSSILMKVPVLC